MKLLVVGAGGQLGSDLVERAEAAGDTVIAPAREALDLERPEAMETVLQPHRPEVVVNCAAYNDTSGAESDAETAFRVNAYGPELLAAAAAGVGARFVHVSTDYVFDGETTRPYTEADPPGPLGIYGASKLVGETLVRRAHPEAWVVRTAALFGLAGRRTGNFVETVLRAAEAGGPLRMVSDVVVSPTATADLASGLLALIRADPAPGLYHVVDRGQASWYEFAVTIVEQAGLAVEVEPVPAASFASPVRRPAYSVLDGSRAAAVTGPMPHWTEGLDRYLEARDRVTGPEQGTDGASL
jgi:dTDP-4-dehydrorhamnose reductase